MKMLKMMAMVPMKMLRNPLMKFPLLINRLLNQKGLKLWIGVRLVKMMIMNKLKPHTSVMFVMTNSVISAQLIIRDLSPQRVTL